MGRKGITDEWLIAAIRQGGKTGEEAMKWMYLDQTFHRGVLTIVKKGGGDQDDFVTVLGDSLIILQGKILEHDFLVEKSLRKLLNKIAKNVWLNHLRKKRSHGHGGDSENMRMVDSAYEKLASKECIEAIQALIKDMQPPCPKLLQLAGLGFNHKEITELLDIDPKRGIFTSKLYRCRKKLRKAMMAQPDLMEFCNSKLRK